MTYALCSTADGSQPLVFGFPSSMCMGWDSGGSGCGFMSKGLPTLWNAREKLFTNPRFSMPFSTENRGYPHEKPTYPQVAEEL